MDSFGNFLTQQVVKVEAGEAVQVDLKAAKEVVGENVQVSVTPTRFELTKKARPFFKKLTIYLIL